MTVWCTICKEYDCKPHNYPVKTWEMYRQDPNPPKDIEPCPICGSPGILWRFSENADAPVKKVVMCSNEDFFLDEDDSLMGSKCIMYLPPDSFYHDRIVDAVSYWNRYARKAADCRTQNFDLAPLAATLRLQKGDVLLLKIGRDVSDAEAWHIKNLVEDTINAPALVISGDVGVSIVRKE